MYFFFYVYRAVYANYVWTSLSGITRKIWRKINRISSIRDDNRSYHLFNLVEISRNPEHNWTRVSEIKSKTAQAKTEFAYKQNW